MAVNELECHTTTYESSMLDRLFADKGLRTQRTFRRIPRTRRVLLGIQTGHILLVELKIIDLPILLDPFMRD